MCSSLSSEEREKKRETEKEEERERRGMGKEGDQGRQRECHTIVIWKGIKSEING